MKFFSLVVLIVALGFAASPAWAFGGNTSYPAARPQAPGHEDLTITDAQNVAHVFHVELAMDPAAQERGLMFRQSVPVDTGMLFLFSDEGDREFWMKNTLVPLDMLFINAKGVIVHIHPDARPNDLTPIPSDSPALAVLELAGGTAAQLGIRPGDKVTDGGAFRPNFRWHNATH